jgi:hypothetical protein
VTVVDWAFFLVGEGGSVETVDEEATAWLFFCAAWEGRVTVVTVLVF